VIYSCHGLGLGHGSRVVRVTVQLTDGSRGSRVTKCDPLWFMWPYSWWDTVSCPLRSVAEPRPQNGYTIW